MKTQIWLALLFTSFLFTGTAGAEEELVVENGVPMLVKTERVVLKTYPKDSIPKGMERCAQEAFENGAAECSREAKPLRVEAGFPVRVTNLITTTQLQFSREAGFGALLVESSRKPDRADGWSVTIFAVILPFIIICIAAVNTREERRKELLKFFGWILGVVVFAVSLGLLFRWLGGHDLGGFIGVFAGAIAGAIAGGFARGFARAFAGAFAGGLAGFFAGIYGFVDGAIPQYFAFLLAAFTFGFILRELALLGDKWQASRKEKLKIQDS